jgi:electron transport complex protein RnfE
MMQAYTPDLHKALGVFIPLIVVNCIILGRAEAFAKSHGIFSSVLDAIGMGIGFTLALLIMGCLREVLGSGSIFGHSFVADGTRTALIFILPPGAFITYGYLIAMFNKVRLKTIDKR